MKSLIVLVVGLLAVGCGKKLTPEEEALRDSVVGEYEFKLGDSVFVQVKGDTDNLVFLDNGVAELYINGKKDYEFKWSISNGEIHVDDDSGVIGVWIINADKSITSIATIRDGKRKAYPKGTNSTRKKIK